MADYLTVLTVATLAGPKQKDAQRTLASPSLKGSLTADYSLRAGAKDLWRADH